MGGGGVWVGGGEVVSRHYSQGSSVQESAVRPAEVALPKAACACYGVGYAE